MKQVQVDQSSTVHGKAALLTFDSFQGVPENKNVPSSDSTSAPTKTKNKDKGDWQRLRLLTQAHSLPYSKPV